MTERNDCIIVVPESGAIGIGVQEYGRGLVCNSNAGIFSFQICKTVAFFSNCTLLPLMKRNNISSLVILIKKDESLKSLEEMLKNE